MSRGAPCCVPLLLHQLQQPRRRTAFFRPSLLSETKRELGWAKSVAAVLCCATPTVQRRGEEPGTAALGRSVRPCLCSPSRCLPSQTRFKNVLLLLLLLPLLLLLLLKSLPSFSSSVFNLGRGADDILREKWGRRVHERGHTLD